MCNLQNAVISRYEAICSHTKTYVIARTTKEDEEICSSNLTRHCETPYLPVHQVL